MAAVLRAAFGYCFLVLMVRIVGRRPGKQMTPFEFVLIFFIGGLTLTQMVADDRSFTNAAAQIMTVVLIHYLITSLRRWSPRFATAADGVPLLLKDRDSWRERTMQQMRIADDDVMAAARDQGLVNLDQVEYAVLERNGEITVIPKKD